MTDQLLKKDVLLVKERGIYILNIKPISNKKVFKVGDWVTIVDPQIFQRCGYPLNKELVKKNLITEEQRQSIWDLLKKFGTDHNASPLFTVNLKSEVEFDKILDMMAYRLLIVHKFGGPNRQIYTEYVPSMEGQSFQIFSKKIVKTGKYFAPNYSYDYYNGGYEWEPGGLTNVKTHVILAGSIDGNLIQIEQQHVKLKTEYYE